MNLNIKNHAFDHNNNIIIIIMGYNFTVIDTHNKVSLFTGNKAKANHQNNKSQYKKV